VDIEVKLQETIPIRRKAVQRQSTEKATLFDLTAQIDPNARLDRKQTAAALTARGFKITPSTLATFTSRGGGPPFSKFGPYVSYRWGSSLSWAKKRTSAPVTLAKSIAHHAQETTQHG
jgi:hypothetical protein